MRDERDEIVDRERRWRHTNTVLIVAGAAAARAVMETAFVYSTRQVSFATALRFTLPSWLFLVPLAVATIALAERFPFERNNRAASAGVHLAACLAFGLVHLCGIAPVRVSMAGDPLVWDRIVREFWVVFRLLFYLDVLTYWAIVGMYLALHYSNLRSNLAEMRLAALRAQLNPHFLFNTLNAISTLALKGDQAAVTETLGRLSSLLRAALDGHTQEISLAREIEILDDYIAIQQIRFADGLSVEKAIASNTLEGLVPTMILQPLVENAIKHGVNGQSGIRRIHVGAAQQNGSLLIEVRDHGPGIRSTTARDGIGLANTRARLEQLYGPHCRFEYGSAAEGGAAVRIAIPFHRTAA